LPIQGTHRVRAQQLGLRQPNQQLSGGGTPVPLLDRPDPAVEPADHVELVDELGNRRDPRGRGQRRVRRADPHTLPDTATTT